MNWSEGQRFGTSGSPYDLVASNKARYRYWQTQGLTADQAADAACFEIGGRGPWQGVRRREVADESPSWYALLDCLVRFPIDVR